MENMRFRQVHLDFHTSPKIPDVGVDFDANQFVNTLKKSHINSVTVFAKCHHGYSYYPTEVGTIHPTLNRDLLGEMIEVCHKEGIKVPAYTTVVWDELAAENADWRQIDREGKLVGRPPLGNHDNDEPETAWKSLCMNSPYIDHLEKHTEEFVKKYDIDGVFFDIVMQTRPGCVCRHCLNSMQEIGLDPENDNDLTKHSLIVERKFMERMTKVVNSIKPDLPIFYNGRIRVDSNVERGIRPELDLMTHIEIESLPSGIWGYNHFPLFSAYYKTFNKEMLGMTGKFHKMWGDFGSLKNQAALEYECFSMLANGAKCSIGDQLHPRGKLDEKAYDLIGNVYKQIEEKEEWCDDVVSIDEIGILTSIDSKGIAHNNDTEANFSDEGAMRMMLELQRPFRVLDEESDFSKLALIIVPDHIIFDEKLTNKINNYLAQGGKLILSHRSGLNENGQFSINFGADYQGDLDYSPDFITLKDSNTDFVVYEKGSKVTQNNHFNGKLDIVGNVSNPYFNRSWEHYISHFHTPVDKESNYPSIIKTENIVYLAHPLFKAYRIHGNRIYKEIVDEGINSLIKEPMIITDLPSTAQLSIMEQPNENRRIIHILHYIHQRRAENLDIIEDIIPLHDHSIKIKTENIPESVYLAPSKEKLSFSKEDDYINVKIPKIDGHEMVVIQD
ncbi:alpha-amylase family protein [Gracilibacillus massiliensis]|uniref:alpha-amylase family protein n=1 Tax=Gracilibacillus massiliensis TaxID=1564956 RepID=UPI00071DB6D9|nr:alpha-amylase family protein [Gracilibacillus massiliensis]